MIKFRIQCGDRLRVSRSGFSLVEALIGVVLLSVVLVGAFSAFAFVMRGDRLLSSQTELDLDARRLVEQMRRDLWLTSRERILVYPEEGEAIAISFPISLSGDAAEVDENGEIIWDTTVIYHLWEDPPEVRRTTFNPRSALTDAQLRQQLEDVVYAGNGSTTFNGQNSNTRPLVGNLVHWELEQSSSRLDTHANSPGRRRLVMGAGLVECGTNTLSFRVVGKNPEGSGSSRHLGIDTLSITPSGLPLEAEWMLPAVDVSGTAPTAENIGTNDFWSGNSRLWFSATSDNNAFSLNFESDRWEDRNFVGITSLSEDLNRFADTINGINTYSLELRGDAITWRAAEQTRDLDGSIAPIHAETVFTNLVRGEDMDPIIYADFDGGWINHSGTNAWLSFLAAEHGVTVANVMIGESAITPLSDFVGPVYSVTFDNQSSVTVTNAAVESDPIPIHIDRDKSYLVRYSLIPDTPGIKRSFTASEGWPTLLSLSGDWDYTDSSGILWEGENVNYTPNPLTFIGAIRFPSQSSSLTFTAPAFSRYIEVRAGHTSEDSHALVLEQEVAGTWQVVGTNRLVHAGTARLYRWTAEGQPTSTRFRLTRQGPTSSEQIVLRQVTASPHGVVVASAESAQPPSSFRDSAYSPNYHDPHDIYAFRSIRTGHAPLGVYNSRIVDTALANPQYLGITWSSSGETLFGLDDTPLQQPAIIVQARAADSLSAVTGSAWEDVTAGLAPPIQGRFAQVRAILQPGVYGEPYRLRETVTPQLHDIIMTWGCEPRIVELSGVFSVGPNQGIYEVLLNGKPLARRTQVELTVFKDVRTAVGSTKRMNASASIEVVPRNTPLR